MLTSAREHPDHRVFHARLLSPFRMLLSECVLIGIRDLYTIQALLLLCSWPLPVRNQRDDPSWHYCSLAVAAILQLGLGESTGFSRLDRVQNLIGDAILRKKTWLACFVVSTSCVIKYPRQCVKALANDFID
jgi:hypothetical protein